MSRLLLCIAAFSVIGACAPTSAPAPAPETKTTSTRSAPVSDQDLCYEKHSSADHDHQASLDPCLRLIATGEYQGFTLARLHNDAGSELTELYRYKDALAAYERAIAVKPDYAKAWRNKSYALMDLYRYEDSLAAINRAIEIEPDSSASVGSANFDKTVQILTVSRSKFTMLCNDLLSYVGQLKLPLQNTL